MMNKSFAPGYYVAIFCLVAPVSLLASSASIAVFLSPKVVILCIIGLVGAAVFFCLTRNIRLLCVWGMIISAPINLAKDFNVVPHMGGAASFSVDLVDFFILGLILFILRDMCWGIRKKIEFPKELWFWGALIAMGCVTVGLGPLRTVAAHEVFRMVKCLVLFLVIYNELSRVKQFEHVLTALMVCVFMQSFVGIIQYVFDINLGMQVLGEATKAGVDYTSAATYQGGGRTYRIGGLIGHPNFLAAFITLIIPMGIASLFSTISLIKKIFFGATIIISMVALILTLSRTGWIAFSGAFLLMNILHFVHPQFKFRYFVPRIIIICIIIMLVFGYSDKILKRIYQSDPGAVDFRKEFILVAWKMIKERPITGFGINSFIFKMPPYTKYGGPNGVTEKFGTNWPVVHNSYLIYWVEQGTIGLLLFLGLHIFVFKAALKNMKYLDSDLLSAINIGCICGLAALMVDGLASFFVRSTATGRMFWIVLAIIMAISRRNATYEKPLALPEKSQ